ALATVEGEGSDLNYRSTSLDQYKGQDIYIAVRHTTTDGFALVLDDFRLAQVDGFDLALFQIPQVDADTGDNYNFTGAVINLGLDTVILDSNQLSISYQIDNDDVQTITINDSFAIFPNDTIRFLHDSVWVPTENRVYRVNLWIAGFGADDVPANDSIGRWQGVGTTTALDPQPAESPINLFPNPTYDLLKISLKAQRPGELRIELLDLRGRIVRPQAILSQNGYEYNLADLPKGVYLLRVQNQEGQTWSERVLKW
ncbi:MAG: T9SS type A sorting domain-containing protein, partial [Bacteroidota bacterium]